jgi:hypothetical protein
MTTANTTNPIAHIGETIHVSATATVIPNDTAVAAAEILLSMGDAHPTGAQIMTLAHGMDEQIMLIGLDGALLHENLNTVEHNVVEATINGPDDAYMAGSAPLPTEAQADAAAALIGTPGGLFSVFGF